MRRVVLWIALVVTALLLQSVVFARFELGGAKPELIYLLTVVVAYIVTEILGARRHRPEDAAVAAPASQG